MADDGGSFGPSELGTKEYWDAVYEQEKTNFKDNGDVGEIWFGEDCMERIVKWFREGSLVQKDDRILDIGCGNGALLVEMAKEGFTSLTGMDYSQPSVDLAVAISKTENVNITYQRADILDEEDPIFSVDRFDICTDKGTYDAISLSPDDASQKRRTYVNHVHRLLKDSGLLVITSCNWTKEELTEHFSSGFELVDEIRHPTFKFGGKTGTTTTSIVFRKKDSR
ncbi:METTL10 [Branchiostoma lanceolatum]|uniref:Protein-lysine N-methyltransferase BLAG_LOCUS19947 n=2 Tax=Branchiostoma lanceolatum TaxID=7740 RepID=A0A8J9ZZ81_BRALA|nr:METTL10 [Branchiostoma lanceolatum]